MYIWIILALYIIAMYMFCYSSIWFVFKFIQTSFKNIKHIICDGFTDTVSYIEGNNRFDDFGYYIYGGDFGNGKTLNMVKHARRLLNHYKKFYKVTVISNMWLNPSHFKDVEILPFEYFEDLEYHPEKSEIVIYMIDEAGSIFYSRNYSKSRLNEEDLVLALNQVRKDNKCILMSCQRHKMLDAALRRVCTVWYEVKKRWRFSFIEVYDGYELEYYPPEEVRPIRYRVEYARNSDRKAYRNKERIVNLNKERLSFTENCSNINVSLQQRKRPQKVRRV